MSKSLVAYFSASGVTAGLAKKLAEAAEADLFEIAAKQPYSEADLNWHDKNSRSSVEMRDAASRPAIAGTVKNIADYNLIFVGFPIWWYTAPTIVKTFLESADFKGKTIVPFATSGGSGIGNSAKDLQAVVPGAKVLEGRLFKSSVSVAELKEWVEQL